MVTTCTATIMAVAVLRVVRVLIMIDLGVVWVLLTLFRILIAVLVLKRKIKERNNKCNI